MEETSSHKMPTQKLKFNSKQKPSDPSYESISDNKESAEFQVNIKKYFELLKCIGTHLQGYFFVEQRCNVFCLLWLFISFFMLVYQ